MVRRQPTSGPIILHDAEATLYIAGGALVAVRDAPGVRTKIFLDDGSEHDVDESAADVVQAWKAAY